MQQVNLNRKKVQVLILTGVLQRSLIFKWRRRTSRQQWSSRYGIFRWCQSMKAGKGIIHDETFNIDSQTGEMMTHGFQFWINLPSKIKAEAPEYMALQASEIPLQIVSNKRGWLKVIAGEYENIQSKIPGYTKQFIYHIHLEKGEIFSLTTENEMEYAVFLPQQQVEVNGHLYQPGDVMEFDRKEGTIEISNSSTE